ncbi:MAG: class I SAM-dependent methyltransferase [Patescibacteria group bacterium]
MGFIFQPNRHVLLQQVTKYAYYIHGRTLDVGCGPTPRYRHLFKECTEYVKMDIEAGENVDVVGFAEAIPFPDDSFDSIVCTETIQDVFEPVKGITEFARVLKKGGVVLMTAPSISRQSESRTDNWRFTRHSFRKLAEDAGFRVEVFEQRGAFWSTRAQLTISYWIAKFGVYGAWYERPFGILASAFGRFSIWLDGFEKEPLRNAFTNGYLLVGRKS